MKKLFLSILILLLSRFCFSQAEVKTESKSENKYPKEVRVNWDTKVFEAPLPIDEPFLLIVYSKSKLPELTLMRYLPRNTFYYADMELEKLEGITDEVVNGISKQIEKTIVKDGDTTLEKTIEYSGDPNKKIPNVAVYRVHPVRANFYYSLLPTTAYEIGKKAEGEGINTNGLNAQKDKGATTNTYLSYQDNNYRKVTAIIGASYIEARTRTIRPYLGLRFHFDPISKQLQSKHYEDMHYNGIWQREIVSRFSLDFGLTLGSIQDTIRHQHDLFGNSNLLTGLGFRIGDGLFLSSGVLWYNKRDVSDALKPKNIIKPAFYISLSFDWDFSKSLDSFKKSLGAPL